MVRSISNFGRSGLSDWMLQRVSAVVMTVYFVWLLALFICHAPTSHADLVSLFSATWVRIFSTLALLSVVVHAWIGAWSIVTDYVTARFFKLELGIELGDKATVLRILLEIVLILLMLVYTLWGLVIIWGA